MGPEHAIEYREAVELPLSKQTIITSKRSKIYK